MWISACLFYRKAKQLRKDKIGYLEYPIYFALLNSLYLCPCISPIPYYQIQRVLWPSCSNFTNLLDSNIKPVNYTLNFKESTSQTESLDFVKAVRNEIGYRGDYKHWTLVMRKTEWEKDYHVNMFLKEEYIPIFQAYKEKSCLCDYGGM